MAFSFKQSIVLFTIIAIITWCLVLIRFQSSKSQPSIDVPPLALSDILSLPTKSSSNHQTSNNFHNKEDLTSSNYHTSNKFLNKVDLTKQKKSPITSTSGFQNKIIQKETSHNIVTNQSSLSNDISKINNILWKDFVSLTLPPFTQSASFSVPASFLTKLCPADMLANLSQGLKHSDYEWCEWALSNAGGRVVPGKSYGILKKHLQDQYERLSCNAVAAGRNPTCEDAWGDPHVYDWLSNPAALPDVCHKEADSKVRCFDSLNRNRFCVFENVMMDFSKMRDVPRPGYTDTRTFDRNFFSVNCGPGAKGDLGPWWPIYSSDASLGSRGDERDICDIVLNEPVVLFSHDDQRNLGHTMSDFLNAWLITLLAGYGPHAKSDVTFLNMDSLRLGHSFRDQPNQFFRHYEVAYNRILKASGFGKKRVCIKQLVVQPRPMVLFTWDGWLQDMPCTFLGPSSMFQRWNIQLRWRYGLLTSTSRTSTSPAQILLLIRKGKSGDGSISHSRFIANTEEVIQMLKGLENVVVTASDLSDYSFDQQMKLISDTSLIVGMHGAGITHSMHMAVGTEVCCGEIEIFPQGEYTRIYGHGNMARKMGVHFKRIDLDARQTESSGTRIPVVLLKKEVTLMLDKIRNKASCIHPSVVNDPYFGKSNTNIWK